jgi:hypothetical protein
MEYIRIVGEDEMHVAEVLDIREIKLSLQEYITDKTKCTSLPFLALEKSYYQNPIWLKPTGIF